MLVDDAQAEVDLVRLLEVGVQVQHTNERLFGVLQGPVPVIQNADAVPQSGHVRIVQIVERPLVCGVRTLQVVHHEVAVAQETPGVSVLLVDVERSLVILGSLAELVSGSADVGDTSQRLGVHGSMAQRQLVQRVRLVQVTKRLGQQSNGDPCDTRGFGENREHIGGLRLALLRLLGLGLGLLLQLCLLGQNVGKHLQLLRHLARREAVGLFHGHLHGDRHGGTLARRHELVVVGEKTFGATRSGEKRSTRSTRDE